MSKAAPSGRASGHVDLMVGALPIQVSLYSATVSDHGISKKQYVATEDDGDHPVGTQNYDKATGEVVEYAQIIKKIETEHGAVYVEDHEIEKLFEITPDTVVVKQFQPIALFRQGAYVPKGLMYVEPRKDKKKGSLNGYSKAAVKALTSLLEAMRDKGVCAVTELTTRGIPKPAVLLPDGTLWLVHHTDALREQREPVEFEVADSDLKLLSVLIESMYGEKPLDLTDERSALIQNFADEKAAEGDFGKPDVVEVEKREEEGMDMTALLLASIEAAKAAS